MFLRSTNGPNHLAPPDTIARVVLHRLDHGAIVTHVYAYRRVQQRAFLDTIARRLNRRSYGNECKEGMFPFGRRTEGLGIGLHLATDWMSIGFRQSDAEGIR